MEFTSYPAWLTVNTRDLGRSRYFAPPPWLGCMPREAQRSTLQVFINFFYLFSFLFLLYFYAFFISTGFSRPSLSTFSPSQFSSILQIIFWCECRAEFNQYSIIIAKVQKTHIHIIFSHTNHYIYHHKFSMYTHLYYNFQCNTTSHTITQCTTNEQFLCFDTKPQVRCPGSAFIIQYLVFHFIRTFDIQIRYPLTQIKLHDLT